VTGQVQTIAGETKRHDRTKTEDSRRTLPLTLYLVVRFREQWTVIDINAGFICHWRILPLFGLIVGCLRGEVFPGSRRVGRPLHSATRWAMSNLQHSRVLNLQLSLRPLVHEWISLRCNKPATRLFTQSLRWLGRGSPRLPRS
jgi:hypothetical protein